MNMKKLSAAVVVMLGMGISMAHAADGSLNFSGTVTGGACSVDASTTALTVNFDAYPVATLNTLSPGQLSAELQKPFTIKLTGCPSSLTRTRINFQGAVSSSTADTFIGSGTARYTGVKITDAETGAIIAANYYASNFKDITPGDNDLNYLVGLTKTSVNTAVAGTINVPLQFDLVYQ